MPDGPKSQKPPLRKSEEEWRADLDPETFRVTRMRGTERAFTGKYHDCKTPGEYRCACCGAVLFDSNTKYDSKSGWPSFWAPADESALSMHTDASHGMRRIEVRCRHCDAHLGHVFEDGPAPTHQRYCINSAALELDPRNDP